MCAFASNLSHKIRNVNEDSARDGAADIWFVWGSLLGGGP